MCMEMAFQVPTGEPARHTREGSDCDPKCPGTGYPKALDAFAGADPRR